MSRPQPGLLLGCLLSPMPRVRSVHCTPPPTHPPQLHAGVQKHLLPWLRTSTRFWCHWLSETLSSEPRAGGSGGTGRGTPQAAHARYTRAVHSCQKHAIQTTYPTHTKHTPHTRTRAAYASTPHIHTPHCTLYIPATHPINTRTAHTHMPAPTRDPDTGSCALGTGLPAATLKGSAATGSHLGPRTRSRLVLPCPS